MSEEAREAWPGAGAGCAHTQTDDSPPQMSSKSDVASTEKWCCEVCTYENFPASKKCTMCRSARPLLDEDIFKLQQEGATAMTSRDEPQQHAATYNEAAGVDLKERLAPARLCSPPRPSSPAINKWSCPSCTYENWPKAHKCAMCGAAARPPSPGSEDNARCRSANRTNLGVNEFSKSQSSLDFDTNNRRSKRNIDWLWLQACLGVVEGCAWRVEAYLDAGGEPARALTGQEVALLDRDSAFDAGHTLVHLAIRFQREDILATLLSRISGGGSGIKRAPSYIAPDLASAIRRHVASVIRHKKGSFQCRYIAEFATFSLPAEIEELPSSIQQQLFTELLDTDAQQTLEADPPLINWSDELTVRLGSRLYALWNRSAGDCLLDAVMQSAWGVFDRDRALRKALAESLHAPGRSLYERWHDWECLQAALLEYTPEEEQLRAEWSRLVCAARTPGTALHQMHVFVLAHVMRRPIIVYGVNVVNSYKGEAIGYANFQGVYLPLLWPEEFCSKWPLCLGYTRGHFSALVPMSHEYMCREEDESEDVVFLPLTDSEGKLLPVHYLNCDEIGEEEVLLRCRLEVCECDGILTAQQRLGPEKLLVSQLLREWLNHYTRLAQQTRGPFPPRLQSLHTHTPAEFSSDGDTDEE